MRKIIILPYLDFVLPSSFTLLLLYWFANVYCCFLVASLGFHLWRLRFHGGTSTTKAITSPFPSPSSFLFYVIDLLILLFFCCCRFKVTCMEAKVSWSNLHEKGNGLPLPFSSFHHVLLGLSSIYFLMFIVVLSLQV